MNVEVIFFASARDWAGTGRLKAELRDGGSLLELTALPALSGLAGKPVRWAVNEEFARPDAVLREGDVVAALPPVSGG